MYNYYTIVIIYIASQYCPSPIAGFSTVREFQEDEVDLATRSYSDVVGKGSFGCVYKGSLNHIPIAVKVLDPVSFCIILTTAFL